MTHELVVKLKTACELIEDRQTLMSALNWLAERRRMATARIADIQAGYPQLLAQAALGEVKETALDDMAASLARLQGSLAEPTDRADAIIRGRVKLVDEKLQRIRTIQQVRDEDLAVRCFFNKILRQQGFRADDEESLRHRAGRNHADAVNRLCSELAEFKRRSAGPVPVRFEDVVTIQPFSEEADTSEIRV